MTVRLLFFLLALAAIVITGSCKKKNTNATDSCFPDTAITRTVVNADGTIITTNGAFYIIEKNTIDTKLFPCNLATEFRIANLPVKFSGAVKNTVANGICCTDNFVITQMSR